MRGPMADWDIKAHLLRLIDFRLAAANWQRAGGKGPKPAPVDLPGQASPGAVQTADLVARLRSAGYIPDDA